MTGHAVVQCPPTLVLYRRRRLAHPRQTCFLCQRDRTCLTSVTVVGEIHTRNTSGIWQVIPRGSASTYAKATPSSNDMLLASYRKGFRRPSSRTRTHTQWSRPRYFSVGEYYPANSMILHVRRTHAICVYCLAF